MKIVLYIILGLIAIAAVFVGGTLLYVKYFDNPKDAANQLSVRAPFNDVVVNSIADLSKNFRNYTRISIAVTIEDSIHYYGLKRYQDTLINESNHDKVFEIGSISKVFTAYVIHHLAQGDKIDLTKGLLDYLPLDNENLKDITVLSLMNHTAGFPKMPDNMKHMYSQDPYKDYGTDQLYEYLESVDKPLIGGDDFDYSNLGYGVLGAIAERVSGQTMEELYRDIIFTPLSMDNSSFYKDSVTNLVWPGLSALDNPSSYWNFDILGAAGAIKSSSDQLILFANHLMSHDTIPAYMRERSFVRDNGRNVGKGLFIIEKDDKAPIYFHNGATGGFNSCMAIDPIANISVAVLSNRNIFTNRNDHIDQMCLTILEELRSQ